MILLIDNEDSFVYNLSRYLDRLGQTTRVVRHDRVRLNEIRELAPKAIVLSPGPGNPQEDSPAVSIVREFWQSLPMLGICLGHQQIAFAMGARIQRSRLPVHGRASAIFHDGQCELSNVPNPFLAARYHSLVVDRDTVPSHLEVSAWTADNLVMGIRRRGTCVMGWQFHPESILTEFGLGLLSGFLTQCGILPAAVADLSCDELPTRTTCSSGAQSKKSHPVTF